MRLFEILLLVLILLTGVRFLIPSLRKAYWQGGMLVALLGLSFLLHVLIEGVRWQMVPVYGLVLIALTITGLAALRHRAVPAWVGVVLATGALLLAIPPALFPVPDLPEPSGPFHVGTTTFYWEDESCPDPDTGEARRLVVQAWYPAGPVDRLPQAPYMDRLEVSGPVVAETFGLPAFILGHIDLARTHSYLEAPVASEQEVYPVLVFSHGWTGLRTQTTFLMEELASHGFIVFSPDHTYGAALTVFPDNTVVLNRPELLPSGVPDEEYAQAVRPLGEMWLGDLQFVLDQAGQIQSEAIVSPLSGHLDLGRVGVLGHSTGGGAAVELCYVDERCRAGLSMDAWLVPYDPQIAVDGLDVPFFFLQSENWGSQANKPLVEGVYTHMNAAAYRASILGTQHYDFSDLPMLTPAASWIGLKGPIQAERTMEIVNALAADFFAAELNGVREVDVAAWAEAFDEVEFDGR